MFAFDTPPLFRPDPVFMQEAFTVRVCLDDPLMDSPDFKKLVSLCAVADVLIERVQKLPKLASAFDVKILQQIEALCKQTAHGKYPQDTLRDLGLLEIFPYLKQGLSGESLAVVPQHQGMSYLNYVSLLNQVVMMGTQLYNDALVPQHHKYCAHQIALLYQTLNMLQGETKPIRRLIEARFDEIKVITESKSPYMPLDVSDWLQEVTYLCRQEIFNCPGYIHKRVEPVVRIMRQR